MAINVNETDIKMDSNGDGLCCPRCGENNLHHDAFDWYWRPAEDRPSNNIRIEYDTATMRPDAAKRNPSTRRDGMRLQFWCEHCHGGDQPERPRFELLIYQHKGTTYIVWDDKTIG